jgi:hypothetical protein
MRGASRKNTRRIGLPLSPSPSLSYSPRFDRLLRSPSPNFSSGGPFRGIRPATKTRPTTDKDARKRRARRGSPARRGERSFQCDVAGACSLIVKLGLITATNYPAVIRVLSERYPERYPPLPAPYSNGRTLSPSSESLPSPYPGRKPEKEKIVPTPKHEGPLLSPFTANEVILSS